MPIKADVNLNSDNEMSRNSTILNIHNTNASTISLNTKKSGAKASMVTGGASGEKGSRIEGGEQLISVIKFFFPPKFSIFDQSIMFQF